MILILSARDDLHAAAAAANLQRRGAEHRWVDPGDAPAKMSLTMRWQGGRARRTLRTRDALVAEVVTDRHGHVFADRLAALRADVVLAGETFAEATGAALAPAPRLLRRPVPGWPPTGRQPR